MTPVPPRLLLVLALHGASVSLVPAGEPPPPPFLKAKTLFQTNRSYDPQIALATDAVIVHRHGASVDYLRATIGSWRGRGYTVGRMFFADSDAANAYWTGKWDGQPHPGDVERDARGEVVKCAGVRPYMLPTEGWIRYLEKMTLDSISAGAQAILPEEPLAHAHTGYEESFRALWVKRYGGPWQPESASLEARFLTAQLKTELYRELERRLAAVTAAESLKRGQQIPFILPVHGLYSNLAAHLVAPLGTSLDVEGISGIIGQVWTGPVNWALSHYGGPDGSFFASAYALYDYFVELTAGTGKPLWLLSDPVEDDPHHTWPQFETWYRHSVVAKLLFPEAAAFEVLPWPERIFLPGDSTGGGTPAPERYRIAILSAIQALQEMPLGGKWQDAAAGHAAGVTGGIGVAVGDTLLWEEDRPHSLRGIYGLLLPLVAEGVPVSSCVMERSRDPAYLSRFRAIVLSYESWKPLDPALDSAIAAWVRRGGSLVLLGGADDLGGAQLWWRKLGHASPLHHLLAELGLDPTREGDFSVGKGRVHRRSVSPRRFADLAAAATEYLPLLDLALKQAGVAGGLRRPGSFCLRRGPFVIAHSTKTALEIPGKLIDLFNPDLAVQDGAKLDPGSSGLYRDVSEVLHPPGGASGAGPASPRVLHATHRLVEDRFRENASQITVRGPEGTPAVVRLHTAGRQPLHFAARDSRRKELPLEKREDGPTLLLLFPNDPAGAVLEIRWGPP